MELRRKERKKRMRVNDIEMHYIPAGRGRT
jgi:hypothetical protein